MYFVRVLYTRWVSYQKGIKMEGRMHMFSQQPWLSCSECIWVEYITKCEGTTGCIVRGWVIHNIYESPQKDYKDVCVCVCVYVHVSSL